MLDGKMVVHFLGYDTKTVSNILHAVMEIE